MALTGAQKLDIRILLGVQVGDRVSNPHRSASEALEEILAALDADQETAVGDILTEFAKVKFTSGRLKGEFEDDPARKRANLRDAMAQVIGFDPEYYGIGGNRFELGRG